MAAMKRTKKQPSAFALLDSDTLPDPDDTLLKRTPDDVVALLGFDPLDDVTDEDAKDAIDPLKLIVTEKKQSPRRQSKRTR